MFHVSSALDLLYNESPGCTTIAPSGTQPLDNSCVPQPGDPTTENRYHDRISEAYPIGGSAGVTQLCAQGTAGVANINYVRQTSAPSATVCTGLDYVAFARDAITFETFPGASGSDFQPGDNQSGACAGDNRHLCLTEAQLQGIFVNCTITNWNQVGGNNAPIKIYTILPQYGTRKAWYTFLGGGSSSSCGAKPSTRPTTARSPRPTWPTRSCRSRSAPGTSATRRSPGGSALGDDRRRRAHADQHPERLASRSLGSSTTSSARRPHKCGTAAQGRAAAIRYIGCERLDLQGGRQPHAVDPITGADYRTEIANTITQYGFVPLPSGADRRRHDHHQLLPAVQDLISR